MSKCRNTNITLNFEHEEGRQPFSREKYNGFLKVNGSFDVIGDSVFSGALYLTGPLTASQDITICENNPNIIFIETDQSNQEWRAGGKNGLFRVRDDTNSIEPFKIEPGASDNSIYIASSGYVGLGVTSPSNKLHVKDDRSGGRVARFVNDGNNVDRYGIVIECGLDSPASNSDCRWIDLRDGDATAVSYIGYSTSSPYAAFYSSSDERLKKNIKLSKVKALNVISKLKLYSFDWINDKRPSQKISFVAQQVESVLPEMVATDKDGYKSVSESVLIKYLVRAVQELKAEIDCLKKNKGS